MVDDISVFPAASESFSQRNLNQSVADAMAASRDVCTEALSAGIRVRAAYWVASSAARLKARSPPPECLSSPSS